MIDQQKYKDLINEVPDFPKDGVSFKDISPLLAHKNMFRLALYDMLQGHNNELWAGVDSRGFLFASGLVGAVLFCFCNLKLAKSS